MKLELSALLERFRRHLADEHRISPYSVLGYLQDLRGVLRALREELGREPVLEDLTRDRLQEHLASLRDEAPATVAHKVYSLRRFYRFLVDRLEMEIRDPARLLIVPKIPRGLPRYLSDDEAAALVGAPLRRGRTAQRLRDAAILEVLYGGGLRAGEAAGLEVRDVRLDSPRPGYVTLRVPGKGNKVRLVVCGRAPCEALRAYLRRRRELQGEGACTALFLATRRGGRGDGPGKPFSRTAITRTVYRYARPLGLAHCYAHLLRATCATHLLDGGAELAAVQDHLGHSDPATTRRYAHVTSDTMLRRCVDLHPRSRPPREELGRHSRGLGEAMRRRREGQGEQEKPGGCRGRHDGGHPPPPPPRRPGRGR